MNPKVRMIKKVIEDQIKLFDAPFVNDYPEKDIIQQIIHGTKGTKFDQALSIPDGSLSLHRGK